MVNEYLFFADSSYPIGSFIIDWVYRASQQVAIFDLTSGDRAVIGVMSYQEIKADKMVLSSLRKYFPEQVKRYIENIGMKE